MERNFYEKMERTAISYVEPIWKAVKIKLFSIQGKV